MAEPRTSPDPRSPAARSAAQRDQLERLALELALAYVVYKTAQAGNPHALARVNSAAKALAKAIGSGASALATGLAAPGAAGLAALPAVTVDSLNQLASDLLGQVSRAGDLSWSALAKARSADGEPLTPEAKTARMRTWAAAWARTEATRKAAETALDVAHEVSARHYEPAGDRLMKLWVSRGDSRVRTLHRHLHGEVRPVTQKFWQWPSTGKSLSYPGDPAAPLEQVINCRCSLWFVPASEAGQVSQALDIPMADFDLVASAATAADMYLAGVVNATELRRALGR